VARQEGRALTEPEVSQARARLVREALAADGAGE
jgi:hypothetical protein